MLGPLPARLRAAGALSTLAMGLGLLCCSLVEATPVRARAALAEGPAAPVPVMAVPATAARAATMAPAQRSVPDFVQGWFDDLSRRAPVERLLARLSRDDLVMVFPERTLRGHADFAGWYAEVGRLYTDQTHTVERLRWSGTGERAGGPVGIQVDVTVIWAATSTADGTRSAFRAHQLWRLRRARDDGRLLITRYHVESLDPLRPRRS